MLPDISIRRIARKEQTLFFSSPVAYLFLGSFVAVSLFVFFWGSAFFARNIADVRPMFEWMPVLLIFLSAALTMRMWSEERRTGTVEFVLTLPVSPWKFVTGKFLACMSLLLLALLLTLPLPVTVSMLADLDWGPVVAGYLAAIFLGAAYISIGLYISARSDNQIVSLMITVLICGLLYLVGSGMLTGFFGNTLAEVLRSFGTGSRFASITRGVIDLRDLYYYLSIVLIFLSLNVHALERQRWAQDGNRARHRKWKWMMALLVVNILAANFWLAPLNKLRIDVTQGKMFSLSSTTENYLAQLQEPLLIRGYFSARTHPLLAPLVPRLKDLLKEYEVLGKGKVKVEIIDPVQYPELEKEANDKYGIKPVPLQVTDKYQAALVNSYFNVLVRYGDQHEVLGFRDLIEVKAQGETDIDVQLRNPEYDITRSIKKVLYAFHSGGNLFTGLDGKLVFTAYISADGRLPKKLLELKQGLQGLLADYQKKSDGRLQVEFAEPEANGGKLAMQLQQRYGFKPMAASLLDTNTFYFYMTLSYKEQLVQIPLPGDFKVESLKRSLDSGLKRLGTGYLKTVGVVAPVLNPYLMQMGMGGKSFRQLKQALGQDMKVKSLELKDGRVPEEVDILLVLAPENLDQKQLFAIDQFLMQGGTVVLATSPYSYELRNNQLMVGRKQSGLDAWLAAYGISFANTLVMDPQNSAFPVPVTRNVGGYSFREMRMLDYPYFVDIRQQGMNKNSAITADLRQLTMAWASPIVIDTKKLSQRNVTKLLWSTDKAWTSNSLDVMPRIRADGGNPFPIGKDVGSKLLSVVMQGKFDSFFKGKTSPLLKEEKDAAKKATKDAKSATARVGSVIEHSPESSRIIVFASNEFLEDQALQLAGMAQGAKYVTPLQLMQNTLEWSVQDSGLSSIRARGHFNRTLPPMERQQQVFWESMNYVSVLVGVGIIALWQRRGAQMRRRRYLAMLQKGRE